MNFYVNCAIAMVLISVLVGVLLYNRKHQRLIVDGLIALLLLGVLGIVLLNRREKHQLTDQYQMVQLALARLHEEALYQGTLAQAQEEKSPQTRFPSWISPLWFHAEGLPMNVVVSGRHPWIDIAPQDDESDHPPDPVATQFTQAGIWYNPNQGVFRARVPSQWSESDTLDLYNMLNNTALEALPQSKDPDRQPLSLVAILKPHTESQDIPADGEQPVYRETLLNTPKTPK